MTPTLGYTIFYVSNVGDTLTFFSEAFGFAIGLHTPENDYGELETGETVLAFVSLGLARANLDEAGGFTPPGPQPGPASITLVVEDVDNTFNASVAAGARSYVRPAEKPWGQTVGYVLGPDNILIEIATAISS